MSKKILIIDDDVNFAEATATLLEANGYKVAIAGGGQEGILMVGTERPDLILLDVMMATNTEGFDVARKLKETETTAGIPVILVTGIKSEMSLPFGFEPNNNWLPVKKVLEKPVKPNILLNAVREIFT